MIWSSFGGAPHVEWSLNKHVWLFVTYVFWRCSWDSTFDQFQFKLRPLGNILIIIHDSSEQLRLSCSVIIDGAAQPELLPPPILSAMWSGGSSAWAAYQHCENSIYACFHAMITEQLSLSCLGAAQPELLPLPSWLPRVSGGSSAWAAYQSWANSIQSCSHAMMTEQLSLSCPGAAQPELLPLPSWLPCVVVGSSVWADYQSCETSICETMFETHQLNWTGHVFQFLRKLNLNTWQWGCSRSYDHFDTMLSWKLWCMPHLWSGAQTPPFFRCVFIHWQTAIHSTPNYATRFVCVRCFTCWQSWLLTCVDNMTVP